MFNQSDRFIYIALDTYTLKCCSNAASEID